MSDAVQITVANACISEKFYSSTLDLRSADRAN